MVNASPEVRLPESWDEAVLECLTRRQAAVPLSTLYVDVKHAAPNLVEQNGHYRDKVRQVVQRLARKGRVVHAGKGVWKAA